jgi:serine phosphatase RsbU (regulator of sigma subunit)
VGPLRGLALEDLVLLEEKEAVERQFDHRNYLALKRLLAVFALLAAASGLLAVFARQPLRGLATLASLALVLGFLAADESELFARHFRQITIGYLVAQLLLLALPLGDPDLAIGLAGFAYPFALLLVRLRILEHLVLFGSCWAVTLLLLYRASGKPVFDAALSTVSVFLLAAFLLAVALTRRQRQIFLADFRREHARSRERLRMRQEIETARRVQLAMLPQASPDLPWVEIAAVSLPAAEVGGDYYGYFVLSPTRLAVVVGDVAGHGLGSGLLLSGVRSCLHLLIEELDRPAEVLRRLDRMVRETTDRRTFVTLLCAVVDREARTLTFASAGHPPALKVPGGELPCGSPPLGTRLGAVYGQETIPFAPGDRLVLYTDGLTEARDHQDREYGGARLQRTIERAGKLRSARGLRDAILEDLSSFKGDGDQADDITLVVLRAR